MIFYDLFIKPNDFIQIVTAKIKIDINTIVPDEVISNTYESNIPVITDETEIVIDSTIVFLKLFPYNIAVIFGMTSRDEISNIPTN